MLRREPPAGRVAGKGEGGIPVAQKEFETTKTDTFGDNMDGQTAEIHTVVSATVVAFAGDAWKHLSLSLVGGHVKPSTSGALAIDREDKAAWYTESVTVKAQLVGVPGVAVIYDSPTTTSNVETLTSNAQFSLSAGGGAMGPLPVFNVGASVDVGTSFSMSFTDFRTEDLTSGEILIHNYLLAATSGGIYNTPVDLVPHGWDWNEWKGSPLYSLPALAKTNFPIASQVLWKTPDATPADAVLEISTTLNLVSIEKTFEVVQIETNVARRSYTSFVSLAIPFTQVIGN
jgi:hypothetical protein